MKQRRQQEGHVGGRVALCAAFTGGVASVYLWGSFSAVLRLCERDSGESATTVYNRFSGGNRSLKVESKVVLVKGVMLLRQHNPDKHRPAVPSGDGGMT
jgi:hypothetical protein